MIGFKMYNKEKIVAIFIDGENLHYTLKALNWKINFRRLLEYFRSSKEYIIYNAFFYTSRANSEARKNFLNSLIFKGYTVRQKEIKQIKNRDGEIIDQKCNVDIEIVIEMFDTIPHYDIAILFSGDSDFVEAVKRLRAKGKRIICVSEKGYASKELVNEVDNFIRLSDLKEHIEELPK